MDGASWGWIAFVIFVALWLLPDLLLWMSGRPTYSRRMKEWDRRLDHLPLFAYVAGASWLGWHLFG